MQCACSLGKKRSARRWLNSFLASQKRRSSRTPVGYADFFTGVQNSITFPRLSGETHAAFL
jgi:hypothetical protein